MEDNVEQPEPTAAERAKAATTMAMAESMTEVITEQRDEIIRRARAKLEAIGIRFDDGVADGKNI